MHPVCDFFCFNVYLMFRADVAGVAEGHGIRVRLPWARRWPLNLNLGVRKRRISVQDVRDLWHKILSSSLNADEVARREVIKKLDKASEDIEREFKFDGSAIAAPEADHRSPALKDSKGDLLPYKISEALDVMKEAKAKNWRGNETPVFKDDQVAFYKELWEKGHTAGYDVGPEREHWMREEGNFGKGCPCIGLRLCLCFRTAITKRKLLNSLTHERRGQNRFSCQLWQRTPHPRDGWCSGTQNPATRPKPGKWSKGPNTLGPAFLRTRSAIICFMQSVKIFFPVGNGCSRLDGAYLCPLHCERPGPAHNAFYRQCTIHPVARMRPNAVCSAGASWCG